VHPEHADLSKRRRGGRDWITTWFPAMSPCPSPYMSTAPPPTSSEQKIARLGSKEEEEEAGRQGKKGVSSFIPDICRDCDRQRTQVELVRIPRDREQGPEWDPVWFANWQLDRLRGLEWHHEWPPQFHTTFFYIYFSNSHPTHRLSSSPLPVGAFNIPPAGRRTISSSFPHNSLLAHTPGLPLSCIGSVEWSVDFWIPCLLCSSSVIPYEMRSCNFFLFTDWSVTCTLRKSMYNIPSLAK